MNEKNVKKKIQQPTLNQSSVTFQDFIAKHYVEKGSFCTNTRITGGLFNIPKDEYPTFLQLYYQDIVSKNRDEFLTEKQLDNEGPIPIDVDFRYTLETTTKQYTNDNVKDLIYLYLEELKNIYQFEEKIPFYIYVMEKPNVNPIKEKNETKDGIHLIITIKTDRKTQIILRERIVKRVSEIWSEIPIINTWDSVFDDGISKGYTNWQLYGSKKPAHEKYTLTQIYQFQYDMTDNEFSEQELNVKMFDFKKNLELLSVRYSGHPSFFFKTDFKIVHDGLSNTLTTTKHTTNNNAIPTNRNISRVTNHEEINKMVGEFLDNLSTTEYKLKEAYQLVMILPEQFYGSGSYDKWIRVCWALSNISKNLCIVWIAFSARASNFDFGTVPDLVNMFMSSDMGSLKKGLHIGSLIYWVQEYAKEDYEKFRNESISGLVDKCIKGLSTNSKVNKRIGCSDVDFANILHKMYQDQYICAAIKADKWYRRKDHRWVEDDGGCSLRSCISQLMRDQFHIKFEYYINLLTDCGSNTDEDKTKKESYEEITKKIGEIITNLGNTTPKDHIMKEAKELFYSPDLKFFDLLDSNPWLLCFNNGILDIKEKVFRAGRADDYVSKCTNIDYIPLDRVRDAKIIEEIDDFMYKIYPILDVREYMWEVFASTLFGKNVHQNMHLLIGWGQNGKSVIMDLMSKVLGDYCKNDVPTAIITSPRVKLGQASPDLVELKGVRLAVCNEPEKGEQIHDGPFKQVTSGIEPIKGRYLFQDNVSFIPQMKIFVPTNNELSVKSTDHGTWRRIVKVDHISLFTDNPKKGDKDQQHQFKNDPNIIEKFESWKTVFMAMLVEIILRTQGTVKRSQTVEDATLKYRESEDVIAGFINSKIFLDEKGKLKQTELTNEFNMWFDQNYGNRSGKPQIKEVKIYFNKKYGQINSETNTWTGVRIRHESDNIVISDDDDEPFEAEIS